MKSNDNKKQITPAEAYQWLTLLTSFVSFIKSIFTKKPDNKEKITNQQPTINPSQDSLFNKKNQN